MKKDPSGKSRGFGFVRFSDGDLQRKVHGMKHAINGRRIELKLPRQVRLVFKSQPGNGTHPCLCLLSVKSITYSPDGNTSLAYLHLSNPQHSPHTPITHLPPSILLLYTFPPPQHTYFTPLKQSPAYMPTKLFVGCLPLKPEVTTDELSNYFGPYGKLDDVYIPKPYRYLHVCTLYTLVNTRM